ncbi:MAG: DNA recombination protein RmuC [Bdellovibrionota bacterium]
MSAFFVPFLFGLILGAGVAYFLSVLSSSKKLELLKLTKENEIALLEQKISVATNEQVLKEKLQAEVFENFANEFLKKGSQTLQESSSKSFEQIVKPLKEKIQDFENKVEKVYEIEARERFNLKKEIEKMAFASESLSKTLRGDFKTQGLWGEIVLERVLEVSGLREGIEYTSQGRDMGLKNESGNQAKPDVIIHLPEGRHLIIDSKVSLGAFEKWIQQNDKEKEIAGRAFTSAVKQHIVDLSEKHYQNLAGIQSPDFVFLFFPIDTAIVALHEIDNSLFLGAWKRRVVLVGPSTLLPTLKTVESIWKNEVQNQNALEIARLGGLLYDKFVSFCEDLLGVGKAISSAQNNYDEALKKLSAGKGNLLRQTERLRDLGVRAQKKLPREMTNELQREEGLSLESHSSDELSE